MAIPLKKIHFLRHPPVEKKANTCFGDSPLTLVPEWKSHTKNWKTLPELPIWVSPSLRCQIPAKAHFKNFNTSPLINEIHFGEWEAKCWDEIPKSEIDNWVSDPLDFKAPQGESFNDLRNRVLEFIKKQNDSEQIWISHQGIFRALLYICGKNTNDASSSQIEYGELKIIDLN
jgi:alpha-ribazole phosphatase